MVMRADPERLAQLQHLAQLRADRELQKFAVFRQHMTTLEGRIATLKAEVLAGYPVEGGFSLAEARRSHAMTRAAAQELRRCEEELIALRPRFEVARQQAMREFGRAEVLEQLRGRAVADRQARRDGAAAALAMGPGL